MEVIVLAGGLGTRLRSVVKEIPKCLAPVNGRPFLGYLLDWLVSQEVNHVVFSVGYLREQVIDYVKSNQWSFTYDFAVEEEPLGTGGGIRLALGKCHESQVFVVNGDTFYPVDLKSIPFTFAITLALKPMKDFDRYGSVSVSEYNPQPVVGNYFSGRYPKNQFPTTSTDPTHEDNSTKPGQSDPTSQPSEKNYFSGRYPKNQFFSVSTKPTPSDPSSQPSEKNQFSSDSTKLALRVLEFKEKQYCSEGLINGGVYAIDRGRLELGSLPEKFSFEKEVLEPGAALGEVGGWVSDAYFIDIGIPKDYQKAQWAIPAWFAVQKASEDILKANATTLFLDRDGVLNRHILGDYVRTPQMWEWMPGILPALAQWSGKFKHIVLVTNQRGVGKGVMTDAQLAQVHAYMMQGVLEAGGRIDLILACTSVSEEDPRRKPNPGMFYEACSLFPDIDAKSSVMLGDAPSDAAFAKNCGIPFILLNPEAAS
jgi:histidinol-phosphate phosphatase family protein